MTLGRDRELIQIVDAAMAEAVRKGGTWIACRPGCTQCCIGAFPISQADAARLRRGLEDLRGCDPAAANRVRERARASVERLAPEFPGDVGTGVLGGSDDDQARFDSFADDEPCPALDPETGRCDLYEARPVTCRTFGPAVRSATGAVGVCELCFDGATAEQVLECAIDLDITGLDEDSEGQTIVAFALRD